MQASAISRQTEVVLSNVQEMGFIDKGTGKHQSNMVYGVDGVCPCEYAGQWKSPHAIIEEQDE